MLREKRANEIVIAIKISMLSKECIQGSIYAGCGDYWESPRGIEGSIAGNVEKGTPLSRLLLEIDSSVGTYQQAWAEHLQLLQAAHKHITGKTRLATGNKPKDRMNAVTLLPVVSISDISLQAQLQLRQ